jgi:hypothetical protein
MIKQNMNHCLGLVSHTIIHPFIMLRNIVRESKQYTMGE